MPAMLSHQVAGVSWQQDTGNGERAQRGVGARLLLAHHAGLQRGLGGQLSGVDRTSAEGFATGVYDPKRKSRLSTRLKHVPK